MSFLTEVAEHKNFGVFIDIVNLVIDQEKNIFFKKNEIEPAKLAVLHSYSRGGIARLVNLIHIIGGAKKELERRSKKRED